MDKFLLPFDTFFLYEKIKNPGLLEIPDGKRAMDLDWSHIERLVNAKGKTMIYKGLMNLYSWNSKKNPELSTWAKRMADKVKELPDKSNDIGTIINANSTEDTNEISTTDKVKTVDYTELAAELTNTFTKDTTYNDFMYIITNIAKNKKYNVTDAEVAAILSMSATELWFRKAITSSAPAKAFDRYTKTKKIPWRKIETYSKIYKENPSKLYKKVIKEL